jgi:hypothetical protein
MVSQTDSPTTTPSESSAATGVDIDLDRPVTMPLSADVYADRLMDDLFEEIDRALDEGSDINPPADPPAETEYVALQPVNVPKIALPVSVLPPRPRLKPDAATLKAIAEAERDAERERQSARSFDRMLIGAAVLSLLTTLGLWVIGRGNTPLATTADTSVAASSAMEQLEPGDREFIAYVQRSLNTIEQRETQDPSQAVQLPNVPVLPVTPVAPLPTPNGTAATSPATPSIPWSSNLTEALNRLSNLLEQVPLTALGQPQPPAPSPGATPPAAPPPAATDNVPAEGAIEAEDPNDQVAAAPTQPNHALVGVLELGERSAALFSIDGVTRRINIGESIGSSGWTLVEVVNQEAKIRRNGEVRTIYIGQRF